MVWYYRLDEQTKVNTRTEIPEEQWVKKNVLPFRREQTTDESLVGLVVGEFEVVEKYYVAPPVEVSLDEVKLSKKSEIKSTFGQIQNEGFTSTTGYKIDCKPEDIANWNSALNLLKLTGLVEITIRDFNNVVQVLTLYQYESLMVELGAYMQGLMGNKWMLEVLVDSKLTVEEVDLIFWRKPIYGGEDGMTLIGYEYNEVL